MDRLPNETLLEICANLPLSGVKSFRLCCRSFASIGATHLLPTIQVICSNHSLDALEAIANHTTLRDYVHTLVYCVRSLPQILRRDDWLSLTETPLLGSSWHSDVSPEQIGLVADLKAVSSFEEYQDS